MLNLEYYDQSCNTMKIVRFKLNPNIISASTNKVTMVKNDTTTSVVVDKYENSMLKYFTAMINNNEYSTDLNLLTL